ncbi:hypothetical protein BATDEDRAFT_10949 [Batrachochytrium dendrobatidis JAM81]|uniref:Uncharacterized protein n=1 Tax=Batrachochytrium dendrobatidis (strain JAM81 / FGSC 10211) TaxID=684364 RepID=F4P1X3_BATDJ|nr:uncharacterized protein BATDEDRAFT_10949 [Batrachochytrium dendrobatidis JAM81]EGF80761.1 hypothetical protein BATDEDRAFT_10949 [Batrachochytrium dendrobatidis JAM81]|eukprot:XP_006678323.1 hypothetical protein BATDEDRAFT_10949 [Batrachochytrium dendrobatidis JAM81]
MVDSLDERIGTIGDQTIRVEKAIRTIRDDSVLLLERLEADIPTNSCMKTLVGHTDSVECVHFESPRALMVSGSADKTVRVWDLTTYGCAAVLTGHTGWIRAVQVRGTTVISGSSDHTLRQWKVNGEKPYQVIHGHSGSVNGVWFDDDQLITGSADRTVKVWDLRNNIQTPSISLCEMRVGGSVTAIACDRTRVIVACGEVGVALLRRNTTGQALLSHCTTLVGHDRPVGAVRVVGDTLVSGAMDQTVRVWRVEI